MPAQKLLGIVTYAAITNMVVCIITPSEIEDIGQIKFYIRSIGEARPFQMIYKSAIFIYALCRSIQYLYHEYIFCSVS